MRQKFHFPGQRSSSVCIKVQRDQLQTTATADAISKLNSRHTHPRTFGISVHHLFYSAWNYIRIRELYSDSGVYMNFAN